MVLSHRRYLLALAILFFVAWALLAIAPFDRKGRVLENALVIVAVLVSAFSYRRFLPGNGPTA